MNYHASILCGPQPHRDDPELYTVTIRSPKPRDLLIKVYGNTAHEAEVDAWMLINLLNAEEPVVPAAAAPGCKRSEPGFWRQLFCTHHFRERDWEDMGTPWMSRCSKCGKEECTYDVGWRDNW